ncbi:MAG TPA: helix-turn-helix domain-containing protein [Bacteroidales bacterium]|jgi:excisionase family DNA binding protein|nr:helix-turn-helix domain-containing protein [Bacteroidales bacterium]
MEVISVSESNIEKWSTLKEVQEYLGVGRETILQWIAKRNMPAYKVGRLWKFKLSEVDEWIRSGGAADNSDSMDSD